MDVKKRRFRLPRVAECRMYWEDYDRATQRCVKRDFNLACAAASFACTAAETQATTLLHPIRSTPPMYGRSTSGTVIEPSAC